LNLKKAKIVAYCMTIFIGISIIIPSKIFSSELSPSQTMWEFMSLGQYKKALTFINKKISANPDSAELYVARGALYAHLKKDINSMRDQNKALEILEKSSNQSDSIYKSNALHNRAALFLRMGKKREAERDYKDSIGAYPKNSGSFLELGKLLLNEKKYAEAKENLIKARELSEKQSGEKHLKEIESLMPIVEKGLSLKD